MAGVQRESVQQFWARVEREGRRTLAERTRARLLAKGNSKREMQSRLVERFQPQDGTRTRAWPTPNSWEHGRKEGKKRMDKQEQLERDALWVHENRDQALDKAPTAGARLLLETAQQDAGAFLKIYLKCLPSIDERERNRVKARRQKVKDQIEKLRKRAAADRRARYRDAERIRTEAEKQAAAEAETRRKSEAQKQADEAENRHQTEKQDQDQRQQRAARRKPPADGQERELAIASMGGEDWETV